MGLDKVKLLSVLKADVARLSREIADLSESGQYGEAHYRDGICSAYELVITRITKGEFDERKESVR